MPDGLHTTLAFLAQTDNDAAAGVFIPALDSRVAAIREGALEAILARPHRAGHRAVIARLHTISPEEQSLVAEHHGRMTAALREAILNADPQTCINGCQAAARFRLVDVIPTLATALEEATGPRAAIVGKTLLDLVDHLGRDGADPRHPEPRPDSSMRRQFASSLEPSLGRFTKHRRREIIEAIALLADCGNGALHQVLEDPFHPAFVALMELLSKSTREAVLRLVLSYLDNPKAPSAVLSVIGKRSDAEFVGLLLRRIGGEMSPAALQNLKRIGSVAWVHNGSLLEQLDGAAQGAAVRLVELCNTPRNQVFDVVKHLLKFGEADGRRAAIEALRQFQGAEANALTLAAMDDDDPGVQAEAVHQLRGRGIAGAMARTMAVLDSPHAAVRDAARQSLAEFTFPRFLAAWDAMDAATRLSTGEIVKKVDPQTVPLLKAEIKSPGRIRRLRAIAIIQTLDLAESVEEAAVELLEDADPDVRTRAAGLLASCQSRTTYVALNAALADGSPAVRDAARKSLLHRARAGAGRGR